MGINHAFFKQSQNRPQKNVRMYMNAQQMFYHVLVLKYNMHVISLNCHSSMKLILM